MPPPSAPPPPPTRRPGRLAWQRHAGAPPALAPPYWAAAAAPPPPARGRGRRTALLVAAACSMTAIARAQVASDGGGGAAPTTGGSTGGGSTGGGPTGGGGTAPAASDAAAGSLRAAVQSVLPTGVNVAPAGGGTQPAWTITPGLSLQEEWTDNALYSAQHKSALITQVSPSLSVNGSTSRVTADLYYAPSLSLYTPESSQNQVGQNLGTDAVITLAPEQFYVRTAGFAAVQSLGAATAAGTNGTNGTNGLNGITVQPTANQVQSYNFSVEPYLTQRIGGWGAVQVGGELSNTSVNIVGDAAPIQNLTTRQEFASYTTGENFGRITSTLSASATQNTGTGALQGATDNVVNDQLGFALSHNVILLAGLGWEDIHYAGTGAPQFSGITWSGGVQYTPNPDSTITVTYGHQQGASAAAVNASYAPTPRIRLFATYQAGVTTATQALNSALAGANFDASGHPVNATTGAPLLPNSGFFGYNGTVYQSKNLSVSVDWLLNRDVFAASLQQQTETPVGTTAVTAAGLLYATVLQANNTITTVPVTVGEGQAATSGTTGSLSWQHDLNPTTNFVLSGQYGVLNNATPLTLSANGRSVTAGKQVQNARLYSFSAAVNWQMTRTLTSTLQYSYTSNDYGSGYPNIAANVVILGLHKTF